MLALKNLWLPCFLLDVGANIFDLRAICMLFAATEAKWSRNQELKAKSQVRMQTWDFSSKMQQMARKTAPDWKTRESADSPPCNCRQLFSAMLKLKCSKPCVFHFFHLSKAFSNVHFVLRGPIQNSANAFSSRRNTQFFFMSRKKLGICILR